MAMMLRGLHTKGVLGPGDWSSQMPSKVLRQQAELCCQSLHAMVAVTKHRKVSLSTNKPPASGLGLGVSCGCVSQKQQTQCNRTSHGYIAALEKSCDSQAFLGCEQGGHAIALSILQDADGRLRLITRGCDDCRLRRLQAQPAWAIGHVRI
jgi:hypothetical protein